MNNRLLIIGLVLLRYVGEVTTKYRGRSHHHKWVDVEPNDIIVTDPVTALTLKRGTQWEEVEGADLDIAPLFASSGNRKDVPDEENQSKASSQEVKEDEETPQAEENQEGSLKAEVNKELTKANIEEFSTGELIKFAKDKKITGVTVRTSREKVIPLILPYID